MVLLVVAALALTATSSAAPLRRFAIVVGTNTGDAGDPPLRFAETDARRMLDMLQDVGGVRPGDAMALYGADASGLRAGLASLEERLRAEASPVDQVVVYVSSHADEGELHLAGGHFPLHELNDFARRVPVAVALIIVDSCQSGAVTRAKGLRPVSGANVAIEKGDVQGRVVMGSSGADEYAQESDALGGSYFTYHLIEALRGAGDISHDRVVTLQEAYTYAYEHTVESTFSSQNGVQHPSYRVELTGQGDLVLSDLDRGHSRLSIAVPAPGEYLISEPSTGAVVGQFWKGQGAALFALPSGTYQVQVLGPQNALSAHVTVPMSGEVTLSPEDFHVVARGSDERKGGGRDPVVGVEAQAATSVVSLRSPMLGAGIQAALPWQPVGPVNEIGLRLFAATGSLTSSDGAIETEVELRAGPGRRWVLGPVSLVAGVEGGGVLVLQQHVPDSTGRDGLEPLAEAVGRAAWRIAGPVGATASLGAGGVVVKSQVDGSELGLMVQPRFELGLGLDVAL